MNLIAPTLTLNTLPIEQNPDFMNLGAHIKLGEDSDSDLTYDSNNDDMYGPAAAFAFLCG
jgi:hypothetical protein